jgi:hypothetical protein
MIRRAYGASTWHLLGHLVLFGVVAYVLVQMVGRRGGVNFVVWLTAGAVLHDAVLLPAYAAVDAVLRRAFGPAVNWVRVPLAISGLLALLFFPLILANGDANFVRAAGHHAGGGFARAWLLISLGLLCGAALTAAGARRWPRRSR